MKINVTGRHAKITQAMHEYAREKASKLDRFFDNLNHVEVVLDIHSLDHAAEMAVHLVRGVSLVGKAHSEDMYHAIDQAEQRLQRQIQKFHDRLKTHRDRRRLSRAPGEARSPGEETYEQIVREMLEEGEQ